MNYDELNETIDRFTRGIIRRKINQLIGRAGFMWQDRDELEQDLVLRVLQSLPSFDPDQAHRNKFITAVVERYVANILRNKRAEKRDHRRISSLNVMVTISEDEATELAETISHRELNSRRNRHPRCDEELSQLTQDVAEVMAKLPDELRDLAERLKAQNISEIARETGIPRTTLYESVRRLRRRFESAGLREYL
ncbi:MAG: sigma-70 family RNA polymerase sigma factor [Planctomycetia bacterium]|nr:sigma-70 family RNA polymerase sigma factor [Planctomycetia bacterium]